VLWRQQHEKGAVRKPCSYIHTYIHTYISCPMGNRGSFPGVKRPGRKADHSHLVLRSKNVWRYTSTPPIRLHGVIAQLKHRDNFTLPLHTYLHTYIHTYIHTYVRTYMEQSPCWENDSCLAGQEIHRHTKPQDCCHVHNDPRSVNDLGQLKPVHVRFSKIHFNIVLPSTLRSTKWSRAFRFYD
jgi:hypothetical protein